MHAATLLLTCGVPSARGVIGWQPITAPTHLLNGGVSTAVVWSRGGQPPLLIVGGTFTMAGGVPAAHLAAWDGTSWTGVGGGVSGRSNPTVNALAIYNNELVVGGWFESVGPAATPTTASGIARWNGTGWSAIASGGSEGVNNTVRALAAYGGELYVGGDFATAGPLTTGVGGIARWNSANGWRTLRSGLTQGGVTGGIVYALAIDHFGRLFVGGLFTHATGIDTPANNVAWWNGSWNILRVGLSAPGVSGVVYALAPYNDNLIIGGDFTISFGMPLGSPHYNIVGWTAGDAWLSLGSGLELDNTVHALTVYNGTLAVGGIFTPAGIMPGTGIPNANSIARWNMNGNVWTSFGTGMGPSVRDVMALTTFNCELVAGGSFQTAGGNPSAFWARWADMMCVADVDDGSGTGVRDCGVTIDDLIYYLTLFEQGVVRADLDDGSSTGTPDGGVTIDDLLYYLFRFGAGC